MLKNLPSFEQLLVFSSIAQNGSVIAAAQELDIPQSTAGRRLNELEKLLGVKLVLRSTRKLSLSSDGEYYLKKFESLINEVKFTLQQIERGEFFAGQNIRISSEVSYGHYVLYPMLDDFLSANSNVDIQVLLENQGSDMIKESYDIAIVIGDLKDSSMVAQRLTPISFSLVKSPNLKINRAMNTLAVLKSLPTIGMSNRKKEVVWSFENDSKHISLQPSITVNDYGFLKELAFQAKGIACLPNYMISDEVERGDLEIVLPQFRPSNKDVYIVYHSRTLVTPLLRQLISHFVQY